MPRLAFLMSIVFSAWRWGDWKNWQRYYGTILFFITTGLLYNVLYANHPLWRFEPTLPTGYILYNNTLISLLVIFIVFPATALIYLGNFPSGSKRYLHIALWIFIFSTEEFIAKTQKGISYYNGWSFGWSIVFNIFMFSMLRLHQKKPFAAWGLSSVFMIFIWIKFGFPIR